jgi:hypothetical protein
VRQVQIVLTAAVLVVLTMIAWQLQQIQRELQPVAGVFYGVALAANRPPETPEEHKRRVEENTRRLQEDLTTILNTPTTSSSPKRR